MPSENRPAVVRERAPGRATLSRFLLGLQVVLLAGLAFALVEIRRIDRRVSALYGASGRGPSPEAPASRPVDPSALLAELRDAADRSLDAVQDPVEQRVAERRMDDAVAALKALGPGAFDAIAGGFDSRAPLPFRRRLLAALEGVDAARATARALQIFRAGGDPALRLTAASLVLRHDPARGLEALVSLVRTESETSFPLLGDAVSIAANQGGPSVVEALRELVRRPDRGRSAAYRAVEGLGRLRAKEAVADLRLVVVAETVDHLFRRKAVQALWEIEGAEVCPFLEGRAREEREEGFRRFLEDTLEKRCRAPK